MTNLKDLVFKLREYLNEGGAGSGNFGHAGRPGEVGGSAPEGEGGGGSSSRKPGQFASVPLETNKNNFFDGDSKNFPDFDDIHFQPEQIKGPSPDKLSKSDTEIVNYLMDDEFDYGLNDRLRQNQGKYQIGGATGEEIKKLDSLISKSKAGRDFTVYLSQQVHQDHENAYPKMSNVDNMIKNDTYKDFGYMKAHTSKSGAIEDAYPSKPRIDYTIEVTKGANVLHPGKTVGWKGSERQDMVVFPRNAKFKVINAEKDPVWNIWRVRLRL